MNRKTLGPGLALLAVTLMPAALVAQDIRTMPDEVQPFWSKYWPAKLADDEEEMDKAVRLNRAMAQRSLNILLDDYCSLHSESLPDEMRALAWSLDRVEHQERYIERVRFVLGLDAAGRQARYALMIEFYDAELAVEDAVASKADSDWDAALAAFNRVAVGLERIGDIEFTLAALKNQADIEQRRNRQWERAVLYKRIAELAPKLAYVDVLAEEAALELERLRAMGFDPDKPKPDPSTMPPAGGGDVAGGGGGAVPTPEGTGRGLDAFAAGSSAVTVTMTLDSPKKGLAPVVLPTFAPLENEYLWYYSWIEGPGPEPFDTQRSAWFGAGGKRWNLLRDEQEFGLDSDGDGDAEVTFLPTSNPQRIEVPLADGRTWPLMVAAPGDREQMFGMELNYSPQPKTARLRFQVAAAQRGEVQGEPWLVYDSNLTGVYGDTVDEWGDGFTATTPGDEPFYRDPDAVLVGKAKVALPWSSVLPLADGFWRATITPDGGEVSVRKLDLQTGQVELDCATKVQPTHVLIEEVGGSLPGALLNVVPAKKGGSVTVPVGTWQFGFGRIESGTKTGMKQVRIYRGHSKPFEVKAGETTKVKFGAPYALRMKPGADDVKTEEGETRVLLHSLRIFGRGGEEYAVLHDEPLQPEVEIVGADGKKGKALKTLRSDISLWEVLGERSLYFPAPLVLPELKGGPHVFRLSQKSHPLLGGPLLPEETDKPAADKGKP